MKIPYFKYLLQKFLLYSIEEDYFNAVFSYDFDFNYMSIIDEDVYAVEVDYEYGGEHEILLV